MERSSAQEASTDASGTLRAMWARELLSVEALKGDIRAGEPVIVGVQVGQASARVPQHVPLNGTQRVAP